MCRRLLYLACLWTGIALIGCGQKPPPVEVPPTEVSVSQPVVKDVTDYRDFTGRTDAVKMVDVRARVTGYITKIGYKDGDIVQEGQLLYQIDPRPYQADLDKAKGQVERYEGQKKLLDIQVERYTKLVAKGAASQQELDQYIGQQAENLGALAAAKSQVVYAQLNLDFCKVTAPITGKISRTYFTEGNLINQDQTLLTTIVSIDPMYGYFDVDERTLLEVQEAQRAGKIKMVKGEVPVLMGLQTDQAYPHDGLLDFINNKLDPLTGTITVRGVFKNVNRYLTPGLFIRVRVPLGDAHPALLVSERAIGTDQGQKFVYVLDEGKKVRYRAVTLGAVHDGLREITEGLKAGEWILVDSLQRVRPGAEVKPDRVPMPRPPAAEKPKPAKEK